MNEDNTPPTVAADNPFSRLGLSEATIAKLAGLHFDAPTQVQEQVIPALLDGKDVLVRARSGEGKTNAYILPIVNRLVADQPLQALIIVPARGIALRLARNLERHTSDQGIRVAVLAGRPQAAAPPERVPHVLIATPRRAAGYVSTLQDDDFADRILVVIDELDALLDLGEGGDLESICDEMPEDLQSLLLTGTIDDDVQAFAEDLQPEAVRFEPDPGPPVVARVAHGFYAIEDGDRFDTLLSICKQTKPRLGLVLARDEVEQVELIDRLRRARVDCRALDESGNTASGGGGGRDGGRRGGPRRGGGGGRREGGSSVIVTATWDARRLSTVPFSHVIHYTTPASPDELAGRLEHLDRLNRQGLSILMLTPDEADFSGQAAAALEVAIEPLEPLAAPERRRGGDEERRDERPAPRARTPRPAAETPPPAPRSAPEEEEAESESDQPPALPKTLGSRFPVRGGRKRFWSR